MPDYNDLLRSQRLLGTRLPRPSSRRSFPAAFFVFLAFFAFFVFLGADPNTNCKIKYPALLHDKHPYTNFKIFLLKRRCFFQQVENK